MKADHTDHTNHTSLSTEQANVQAQVSKELVKAGVDSVNILHDSVCITLPRNAALQIADSLEARATQLKSDYDFGIVQEDPDDKVAAWLDELAALIRQQAERGETQEERD